MIYVSLFGYNYLHQNDANAERKGYFQESSSCSVCIQSWLGKFLRNSSSFFILEAWLQFSTLMPPLEKTSSIMTLCKDGDIEKEDSVRRAASLATNVEPQVPALNVLGSVVLEPKTKIEFPSFLSCKDRSSGASSQVLAGVGINSLNIVRIKTIRIYAFGFYINPDGLMAQLGGNYGSFSAEELKNNPAFYEDLLRHDLEMTVRLVVHYKGLRAGMVRSAFDSSLRNRLKKIKGEEDDEGLHIFNSYFSESLTLTRGTIIDFQRLSGGQLRTEINGSLIGNIYSNDFCRALFDIYIGDPPVSLRAKQEVGEKISQLLKC
eukprot:c8432_g1_i1 orf=200-1156(-)